MENDSTADTTTDSATVDPSVANTATVDNSQTTTTGSEADNNSSEEAMVPSHRVREETEQRHKAEERARELEERIAAMEARNTQSSDEEVELEPDTERLLDAYVKKHGFVSQKELADERNRLQVQQDVRDLTDQYAKSGIPFEDRKVFDYAQQNNLPITSKAALDAAYKQMNWDKIVEAERQRAIDQFKTGNSSSAEKPGSSAPRTTEEPTPGDLKSRIHAARLKLNR